MIAIERNKNGILRLILVNDAPNLDAPQKGKLLDRAWLMDFAEVFETIIEDDSLRGVIICGEGEDFHSGLDLAEIYDVDDKAEITAYCGAMHQLSRFIETASLPIIAVLTGHAFGAGLDLALSCHHVLALDDDNIALGYPDIHYGTIPSFGATQRLPRKIGIKPAAEMLLSGKSISPIKAQKLGLIDAVYASDKLLEMAEAWIEKAIIENTYQAAWDKKHFKLPDGEMSLLKNRVFFLNATSAARAESWGHNTAAIAILSAMYEGLHVAFDTGLKIEARYFTKEFSTARKLIRANLLLPAAAKNSQKRGDALPETRFNHIGIIGGGFMGAAIAKTVLNNGFPVYIIEKCPKTLEALKQNIDDKNFSCGEDFSKLQQCDLVIEALPEDLELKKELLEKARNYMAETAILATNTSSLPLEMLAPQKAANLFCGLHFFSPVEKVPLVEIIVGLETDENTRCRALDFVMQLQKCPIIVNDGAGFFTTRIFIAYIMQALLMLEEGIKPALIENAAKLAGMAMSPLNLIDMVGMQHLEKIMSQNEAGLDLTYLPAVSALKIERKFYDEEQRLAPWLTKNYELAMAQPDVENIQNRFLFAQSIEALRILNDGILRHHEDADLASIMGLGFPASTGGVFSFIKNMGAEVFFERAQKLEKSYGSPFIMPDSWEQIKKRLF